MQKGHATASRENSKTAKGARRPYRPSAVSQILKRIQVEMPSAHPHWLLHDRDGAPTDSRFLVANSDALRRRAAALKHRVYQSCGYSAGESQQTAEERRPVVSFLAQRHAAGEPVRDLATVSHVLDGPHGLPCDEIFHQEVDDLRARGRRITEVTGLAMDRSAAQDRTLLMRLIDFVHISSRHLHACDEMIIEVNPRHVGFYRKFLFFEIIGESRPCPRVNNAPAVLLALDLPEAAARLEDPQATRELARSLYPYLYRGRRLEQAIAFLRRNGAAINAAQPEPAHA